MGAEKRSEDFVSKKKKKKGPERSATFKDDFVNAGPNEKKLFGNVLTKYGVSGYKLGIAIPGSGGFFADFVFLDKRIAVCVDNYDVTSSEISQLERLGWLVLLVSSQDRDEWLEAVAAIVGVNLNALRPKHPWMLRGRFEKGVGDGNQREWIRVGV